MTRPSAAIAEPGDEGPPLLHVDGDGIAQLTLRRPRHLNRLHREDLLALQQHLGTLQAGRHARVLVLTGLGRAFCAGYHLGELGAGADSASADPRLFEHVVDRLEALPLPTIARLNGGVYGGATDLALACDFRIGVEGMELRMPAARLGLHFYPGGMQRYVSRLGLGTAKRLFLCADSVPATELLRLGYLDRCVAAGGLDEAVHELAATLCRNAPLAVQGMKLSLNDLARDPGELSALREREAACAASSDLREGLAAFAERREPRFCGR
jgi:enoyl-CoA hydratase